MSVSSRLAPASSRLPRTERTRRRLLEAGRALFAEHGPESVTSHAIAAEAGFASGTFYLHFKHKQALFQELADEATSELETRLARVFAASGGDPHALVLAQAEALVGFAEEHRELFRIVFRPSGEPGEAGETGARVLERLARGIRARRHAATAAGREWTCLDADVLAQALVGMWVRVLGWWVEDPTRASRADLIRTLTHFQLHGSRAASGAPCPENKTARAPRRRGAVRP